VIIIVLLLIGLIQKNWKPLGYFLWFYIVGGVLGGVMFIWADGDWLNGIGAFIGSFIFFLLSRYLLRLKPKKEESHEQLSDYLQNLEPKTEENHELISKRSNVITFNEWPGSPPTRCHLCNRKLKKTCVFGDTKHGQRNVIMCERCFRKKGETRATYGKSRRYAKISGRWVSGSDPQWHPDNIPDGTKIKILYQFSDRSEELTYKESLLGK
jgi:hypothetical protein